MAPEKIIVVMNTVDERLLPATGMNSREDGFRVVYHGTITPHYGVNLLVEAVARVVDDVDEFGWRSTVTETPWRA